MTRLAPILAIALLAGCSSHYSVSDLAGKYVFSHDGLVDTVVLDATGTYSESYRSKNGQAGRQEGTWNLEYLQAGPTVVLNNFRSPFREDGQKPGFYFLLVERSFGSLYLITNIDLNEGYKKQP